MKAIQPGSLMIETLVYASLLAVTALLIARVLVYTTAFNRILMHQVTAQCQISNALALVRKDLAYAPRLSTAYTVLTPTHITYTTNHDGESISWQVDQQRLIRIHTHKQADHIIRDHAVVLESLSAGTFTPGLVQGRVHFFEIKLSHNDKFHKTIIYNRDVS